MARNQDKLSKSRSDANEANEHSKSTRGRSGKLARAASTVSRTFSRARQLIASKVRGGEQDQAEVETVRVDLTRYKAVVGSRRPQSDIPFDLISETYSPTQTSVKAGFRTDGADHQRDQEFATGVADTKWRDEDVLTNKSRDPRIGTHGRTYEGRRATTTDADSLEAK